MNGKLDDPLGRWQKKGRLALTTQSKAAGRERGKDFHKRFFYNGSCCDQIIYFNGSGFSGSVIYPLCQISWITWAMPFYTPKTKLLYLSFLENNNQLPFNPQKAVFPRLKHTQQIKNLKRIFIPLSCSQYFPNSKTSLIITDFLELKKKVLLNM